MFTSHEWKFRKFAKTNYGKMVEDVVLDKHFFEEYHNLFEGCMPLIEELRLVNSDQKPAMGFIYEAMNQAKETLQGHHEIETNI